MNDSTAETADSALFPIALSKLAGARVIVVGGGRVAERKISALLAVGAMVCVISPTVTAGLRALIDAGRAEWIDRGYATGDLAGAKLAVVATDQRAVNALAAQDAAQAEILCNVADRPDEGDVHLPAVLRMDGLVIAVSTEAGDPRRAVAVRDAIRAWLGQG